MTRGYSLGVSENWPSPSDGHCRFGERALVHPGLTRLEDGSGSAIA